MKKILLAVLLSLAVASGFAAGSKTYSSFGFHFSTPFMFEFGSANGEKILALLTLLHLELMQLTYIAKK